jgi:mono/diheme cytochrome c family protein
MKAKIATCCFALGSVLVSVAPLIGAQNQTSQTTKQAARPAAHAQSQDADEEGQRVFEQNCARCHNPPDGFSPRITGAIVRHMRVRANLSKHDEEVLLHYFNP